MGYPYGALVAKLAAIVTGCGLPTLPIGVTRSSDQGRNLCSEDRPNSVWQSTCEAAVGPLHDDAAVPVVAAAPPSPQKLGTEVPIIQSSAGLHIKAALDDRSPSNLQRRSREDPRKVSFNLELSTSHEITPYSEVYGIHPREFQFARSKEARLFDGTYFIDIEMKAGYRAGSRERKASPDEEEEEPDSLSANALALLGANQHRWKMGSLCASSSLSRPCWFTVGAMCIMMRMFGVQVCMELLSEALAMPKEAWAGLSSH